MFDTKIAIVVRDDLATWQKLNVTVFLTSGIIGANGALLGEPYEDAAGNGYNRLLIQPAIVLAADADTIAAIYRRAMERGVRLSLYIEDMFRTGHDAANRETVRGRRPEEMTVVGLALREDRKLVDKITKGARMHP
ncbi:DUF2000 family protein [Labrys wisconsinensis]|uniref:DUF2000 domain-containing protein n=1 Tax=Labrys wisconsinensis TaxID=425677 RepID=A0ABU0J8Q3_9HYPH|nr:DUF2000 family protein [Labrys wisconsinensis]MDQ0470661.1 hypothetical protein [Labrys wisconsinensis]